MRSIIITGAEGFIGSNLVKYLNENGISNIILVDSVNNGYLNDAKFIKSITIEEFILFCMAWARDNERFETGNIEAVFHLGALVDTSGRDMRIMDYNLTFSQMLFDLCASKDIPFFFASSGAVYGKSNTFKEDEENLQPLNIYAKSKYLFDKYVLNYLENRPAYWYGFRFFNVYGPNELHKGNMTSAVTQIYLKALKKGEISLFKSIEPGIKDGLQMRDFIHVNDVVKTLYFFYKNKENIPCGIYNLGTGKAVTFLELARQVNISLNLKMKIRFIDTPEGIKNSYQSFTKADMGKMNKYIPSSYFEDFESSVQAHFKYLKQINETKSNQT
jgi:ADP-L-glycero-D-manno-heptose 6-epimerase